MKMKFGIDDLSIIAEALATAMDNTGNAEVYEEMERIYNLICIQLEQ
jgi:hypothetical protein